VAKGSGGYKVTQKVGRLPGRVTGAGKGKRRPTNAKLTSALKSRKGDKGDPLEVERLGKDLRI